MTTGTRQEPDILIPDVTGEVLQHLAELREMQKKAQERRAPDAVGKTSEKVNQYDIVKDIEDKLAEVTIGQLLKDNPKYRKQVLDSVQIRRRRRLPTTFADVRFTEVEDWGAQR